MKINKKLIKYNFTPNKNKPEYIVIHDTGNFAATANAEMHYKYFNGGNRDASAHLFVDDTQILQLVEFKDSSWHCGDGKGKYGITNSNSIGIEICVNQGNDYNKTIEQTVDLVVLLMLEFKIPLDKVVRHFDASKKNCPQTMNNGTWAKWKEFKEIVSKKYIEKTKPINKPITPINKEDEPMIEQWKVNILKNLHDDGLVLDFNEWVKKLNDTAPVWLVMALINNLNNKLKEKDGVK